MRYTRRELGSKHFGRVFRKWRLHAGISQEDLAERANVSVTLVGAIEREKGPVSEEVFVKLCLGLESALGRPMLRAVLVEGMEGLWSTLRSAERSMREERGWAPAEYVRAETSREDVERGLEAVFSEVKKLALLGFSALGALRVERGGRSPLVSEPEVAAPVVGRARVGKGRKKERAAGGGERS